MLTRRAARSLDAKSNRFFLTMWLARAGRHCDDPLQQALKRHSVR
jgi:hypothetical protein